MWGCGFRVLRVLCVFAMMLIFVFLFWVGDVCMGVFESNNCEDLEGGKVLSSGVDNLLERFSVYICVKSVDVFARKGFGEVTVSATLSYVNESRLPEDIFVFLSTYRAYYFRLEYAGDGFYAFTQRNVTFDLDGYGEFYPFDSYNITVEVEVVLHKVAYDSNVTKVAVKTDVLYWDCVNRSDGIEVDDDVLRVKVSFVVAREPWYHFPLRLFYLFFYFALGCVSFLETNEKEVSYRLGYLSVLVALFGLFSLGFSGDAPPALTYLSLCDVLMVCSFCSFVVFFVGSVVAYRWGGPRILVDFAAVVVSVVITSFSIKIFIFRCYAEKYVYSFRWLVWLMRGILGAMFAGMGTYIFYRVCYYGYKMRVWPRMCRNRWLRYVLYIFVLDVVLMLCLTVVVFGWVWLIGFKVVFDSFYGQFFILSLVVVLGVFLFKKFPEYFDLVALSLFFMLLFFFFDVVFRVSLVGGLFLFIYIIVSLLLALGVRFFVHRYMLVD